MKLDRAQLPALPNGLVVCLASRGGGGAVGNPALATEDESLRSGIKLRMIVVGNYGIVRQNAERFNPVNGRLGLILPE